MLLIMGLSIAWFSDRSRISSNLLQQSWNLNRCKLIETWKFSIWNADWLHKSSRFYQPERLTQASISNPSKRFILHYVVSIASLSHLRFFETPSIFKFVRVVILRITTLSKKKIWLCNFYFLRLVDSPINT